jgi:hypothetical protein
MIILCCFQNQENKPCYTFTIIRPIEPTIITTSSSEEVFALTLTKSEWKAVQKKLELKQPKGKKRTLPTPVKLEGILTASDYVQAARG